MKAKSLLYLLPTALVLFTFGQFETAFAQTNCLPVFNGGQTTRQVCTNPTQKPTNPSGASEQTKGGLPIYPASNTKSTPNTGPEDWALPTLLVLGVIGLVLRDKSKKVTD